VCQPTINEYDDEIPKRSLRITGVGVVLLNAATQILLRPTPVAIATTFWTKSAITRLV